MRFTYSQYIEIRERLDVLNNDQSHFQNSNDICTPMGCVEEMVNTIPRSFWRRKHIKVLDPCTGNGNFPAYVSTKIDVENIHFNEINPKRIAHLKSIFGKDINLTTKDFLTIDDEEEYDLIVCNPPYASFTADGKRAAKNHNMSRDFILKALQKTRRNGYILFIVPDNWMSLSDRNNTVEILSQYQFIHLNIHGAKKWFPKVGSSFTWFILKKTPNVKSFTIENFYHTKSVNKARLTIGARYIPLYFSEVVQSIFEKTIDANNEKFGIETSSNLHKYTKKNNLSTEKTDKFKHRVQHTPTQVVWSNIAHKFQSGYKVFISLTNKYGTFVEKGGMTQSIAFIKGKTKIEAEALSAELNNEIYRFINNVTRYGNFNNIRILQKLPRLHDIHLTNEEMEIIIKYNDEY